MNIRHSILFILPVFSGGGAERVVLNIVTELCKRKHSIGIIVFDNTGPLLQLLPDNVHIYNLGTLRLRRSFVPLIKKLRKLNPKVIFSTLGYVNVTLLAIRLFLPSKIKIWIREANLPSISLKNNSYPKLMPLLYRILYARADKVICTSKIMKDEFLLDFKIPKSSIEILPNPVNIKMIHELSEPVERFDKGGVCYIAAGRLTFQKGFDRLLDWFSELNDKKSTLVILGNGSLKNELILKTRLLNIQKNIKFVEFCDNPWKWYAGADIFLLPSRWEGMPNSVLESLACGTPVIATSESGGIKDIVSQVENADMITVVNSNQFANTMNKVIIKNKGFGLKSYLPKIYKQKNVVNIIENWLNELE